MEVPLLFSKSNDVTSITQPPSLTDIDTPMSPRSAQENRDPPQTPFSERPVSNARHSQRRKSVSSALRSTRILDTPASPETPRGKKQMTAARSTSRESSGSPLRNLPLNKALKPVRSKRNSLSILTNVLENRHSEDRTHAGHRHARTKTADDITMDVHDSLFSELKSGAASAVSAPSAADNARQGRTTGEGVDSWSPIDPRLISNWGAGLSPSSARQVAETMAELEAPAMLGSRGKGRLSYHKRNRAVVPSENATRGSTASSRSLRAVKSTLLKPSASVNALKAAFTSPPLSGSNDLESTFAPRGRSKETSAVQKGEAAREPLVSAHKVLQEQRNQHDKTEKALKDPSSIPKHSAPKSNLNFLFDKRSAHPPRSSHQSAARGFVEQNVALLLAPYTSPQSRSDLSGFGIVHGHLSDGSGADIEHHADRLAALAGTPLAMQRASPSMVLRTPRAMFQEAIPRIVVTPPPIAVRARVRRTSLQAAMQAEERERSPAVEGDREVANASAEPKINEASQVADSSRSATSSEAEVPATFVAPFEQDVPLLELQEQRAAEDSKGLSRFKMVIDAFLCDFFVQRGQGDVRSMAVRLLDLLGSSMDPDGSCDFRIVGRPAQIPSLCAICSVGKGFTSVNLRPSWVRWKLQTSIDLVLEHIITGMIAVIVDDRAPFGTPRNVAFLASVISQDCVPPQFIHTDKAGTADTRSPPDTALGNWVQLCASAVGIGAPHRERAFTTPLQLASNLMLSSEEREQWQRCLDGIDPGERFAVLLRQHVNAILEHGEALRARNNLLVVPPARLGSRKRWEAAQVEAQKQRAQHDENFVKLTKGEISESQYRSEERRRAAIGNPRDSFAALDLVRFVGELYKVAIVDIHTVRAWIRRLLFDTAYLDVPSMYELEAGCALLITVGAHLDNLSDSSRAPKDDELDMFSPNFSHELLGQSTDSQLRSPSSAVARSRAISAPGAVSEAALARMTMASSIERLREIQRIKEVEEEGRSWCREVIALHGRGWRPMPSTRHMDAISSAGRAARRNRRGGSGHRAHSAPSSDADVPIAASWSEDETWKFTSTPPRK